MDQERFLPRKNILDTIKTIEKKGGEETKETKDVKKSAEEREKDFKAHQDKMSKISQRVQEDQIRINEIRRELGVVSRPTTENAMSQEKKLPVDIGIEFWEDRAKKSLDNIELYEGLLENKNQFYEMHGELADYLWDRLPFLIDKEKTELEESRAVAEAIRKNKTS